MTIKAHFDGKVLVPDEPLNLTKDQHVLLHISPVSAQPTQRVTGPELARIVQNDPAWADRGDIGDSVDFVNDVRRRIELGEL